MSDDATQQGTADEPTLTPAEQDLAIIANLARIDAYLQRVASSADDGLGAPVTLLTSGGVIVGTLASERAMAQVVDELNEKFIEAGERSPQAEKWKLVREKVAGGEVKAADKRADERRDYFERATKIEDFDVLKVPKELGRETIRHLSRPVITVVNATVWANGQTQPLKAKALRVHVAQVAAWWPGTAAEQPEDSGEDA